jgi:hypothetical protein
MNKTVGSLLLALAASLACTGAQAQGKPNFSGTWKQNNAKSTVRSGPGSFSYTNGIVQEGALLEVTTIFSGSRGTSQFTDTYTIGGKSEVSKDREGDEIRTSVKWNGPALEFRRVEEEKGHQIVTNETWTLSRDGRVLTKIRHSSGPHGTYNDKYVLEKQ